MTYTAPQRLSANLKALLEKTPHNASLVTVERLARGLSVEPWELLR